jgi:internalin A
MTRFHPVIGLAALALAAAGACRTPPTASPDQTQPLADADDDDDEAATSPTTGPSACAEPLAFPNPELERWMRSAIGKPEGPISRADVAGVETLQLMVENDVALDGIECVPALRVLTIEWREEEGFRSAMGQQIRHLFMNDTHLDLAPLAALTRLEELRVVGAQITDLLPLAGLSRLKIVDLQRTSLDAPSFMGVTHGESTTPELRTLAAATGLVELHLRFGQVTSLAGIDAFPELRTLDLRHNNLSDLAPLKVLRNLERLDISYNSPALGDLTPLLDLLRLTRLDIGNSLVCDAPHPVLDTLRSRGVTVEGTCP